MITFCVICYGCRGKQINHTLLQLHFSSSLMLIFPQHFFPLFELVQNSLFLRTLFSYHKLMRNLSSEYTWAIFKSLFHVIPLPSVLLIPLHLMFSVCLAKWPQMPGFYREKYIFSAAICLASPESEVIIYLICSPNKLLTLIFVSQHVSS